MNIKYARKLNQWETHSQRVCKMQRRQTPKSQRQKNATKQKNKNTQKNARRY